MIIDKIYIDNWKIDNYSIVQIKVMQTNFDEFPGFLMKIGLKQNFGDISPHFRDTYCFDPAAHGTLPQIFDQ